MVMEMCSMFLLVVWMSSAYCDIKTQSFTRMFTDFKPEPDQPIEFVGVDLEAVTFMSTSPNVLCSLYCYTLSPCFIYCFDEDSSSCLLAHDIRRPFDPDIPTVPIPPDVESYSCYKRTNFYGNITATPLVGVNMSQGLSANKTHPPSYQKPGWLSSFRPSSFPIVPLMANDGNYDTEFFHQSCIHTIEATAKDLIPYWYIDLLATYAIFSVNITNRAGSQRLHDVDVRAGYYKFNNASNRLFQKNELCYSFNPPLMSPINVFRGCNSAPLAGRYVSVQIVRFCGTQPNCMVNEANNTNILTMCEVDVYGVKLGNVTMGDY